MEAAVRSVGLVTTLIATGCWGTEAPPPSFEARGELAHTMGIPLLIDTSTVPAAYAQAEALFRTSTTAFAQGRVVEAAEGFLELGYGLKAATPAPEHAGAYQAARCIAYQNAATVWLRAEQPRAAKAVLWAAEARDPECDHSIAQVFRRVELAAGTVSATTSSTAPTRQDR